MAIDVYMKVGAQIRSRRTEAGMTQACLASKAGLGRTSLTNIENGTQSILLHQLVDVACALRLDPSLLLVDRECGREDVPSGGPSDAFVELLGKLDRPVQARRR